MYWPSGAPELRESVVVYIDALGTKDRVASLDNAGLADDITALDAARPFLFDAAEGDDELGIRFLSFTDNTVLGSPITAATAGVDLAYLMLAAQQYQAAMLVTGRLVRGAITSGPLYMDDEMATGQGLVDAVNLEERAARDPRVVLDDSVISYVRQDIDASYHGDTMASDWAGSLAVDSDGRVFINYLEPLLLMEVWDCMRQLTLMKDVLIPKLHQFASHPALSKYVWACQFHNFVCGTVTAFDASELTVPIAIGGQPIAPRAFATLDTVLPPLPVSN